MKLKETKFNIILTTIYILILSIYNNANITYIFFSILFILEFYYLLKRKYKSIICQIILLIPLLGITTINYLPLSNIYSSIFAIYYLLFEKKYAHSKKIIILYFMFIAVDFLKYLLFMNNVTGIVSYFSVPAFYLSVYAGIVCYECISNEKSYINYTNVFVYGTLLSIVYGFITRYRFGNLMYALVNNSILTRNYGASGDPNYFGLYIGISAAILLLNQKNSKYKFFYYIAIFLLLFLGLSSSSRMYYVIVIFLLIVMLFQFLRKLFSKDFKKTIVTITFLFLLIFLLKDYLYSNISYVLYRITTANDISNGRYNLISEYYFFISNDFFKPFFGIGIPQYNVRAGIDHYAHNLYLELFITQGVLEVIFIINIIILYIIKNIKKIDLYGTLPLLVFLIGGFGVNYIEIDSFYILFFLIICCMKRSEFYE